MAARGESEGRTASAFETTLQIPAPVDQVFAAIGDPERLARWWGPAGFTNTFTTCDFRNGGRWSFVMHGPDGRDYPNESVFAAIDAPHEIVIEHVSEPKFHLTIALAATTEGTLVRWSQAFASAEVARRLEHIVVPANRQNLERLAAEVRHKPI